MGRTNARQAVSLQNSRHDHMKPGYLPICALFVCSSVFLAGCSTKAWYGGMKFAAQNDCRRQPPSEVDGCLPRLNTMSYEEYERSRSGKNR